MCSGSWLRGGNPYGDVCVSPVCSLQVAIVVDGVVGMEDLLLLFSKFVTSRITTLRGHRAFVFFLPCLVETSQTSRPGTATWEMWASGGGGCKQGWPSSPPPQGTTHPSPTPACSSTHGYSSAGMESQSICLSARLFALSAALFQPVWKSASDIFSVSPA